MADDQSSGSEQAGPSEAAIRARVDQLIAGMTVAEKAGQLTQTSTSAHWRTPRPSRSAGTRSPGRARAGDPRHLVPRHPGRDGGREPLVRGRLAGREAAVHLAAHGRAGADDLCPHALARARQPGKAVLGRGEHAAVPVRARPRLLPLRLQQPRRRPCVDRCGRVRHGLGDRHQLRRPGGRRGGSAIPPPAVRDGIAPGSRAQRASSA